MRKTSKRKISKRKFSKKKSLRPKKTKNEKTKTENSVTKAYKSTKHFKHENITREFNLENRHYKTSKKPTSCQRQNCGEVGCNKRKANIVKLFSEEFDEIQDELYLINSNIYDIISSCYESISSKVVTNTFETESYLDTEDKY